MPRYSTAGLKFYRSTNGTAYDQVLNVASYDVGGAAKEQQEATALEDTARQYVDSLPGFGQVTLTVYWDPGDAVHRNLFADFSAANTSRFWKIEHPASGTIGDQTFQGPVVGMSESAAPNGVHQRSFTIQISGAITLATS
jgi:hypothetical protein